MLLLLLPLWQQPQGALLPAPVQQPAVAAGLLGPQGQAVAAPVGGLLLLLLAAAEGGQRGQAVAPPKLPQPGVPPLLAVVVQHSRLPGLRVGERGQQGQPAAGQAPHPPPLALLPRAVQRGVARRRVQVPPHCQPSHHNFRCRCR